MINDLLGQIGFVTDSGQMVVKNHGEVVADLPASKLADDAPAITAKPRNRLTTEVRSFVAGVEDLEDPTEVLEKLLEWPIASKNWVYRRTIT